MVENRIISFGDIAYVLGMSSKKLSRWYKHVLSGYMLAKKEKITRVHDYKPKDKSAKSIRVPLVIMANYGKELAIDEKHIRGMYHTIISNSKTGKIILMARTMKSKELYDIVRKHFTPEQMMGVEVVTKDGAECFDWLARQAFPNAMKVLDKFHVLKWVFDALQIIRHQLKIDYIIDQQREQNELNIQYQIALKIAKAQGEKISKRDFILKPIIHSNGDDTKQLITRSRYLLYKYEDQWNNNQVTRAQILFDLYPNLMEIYIDVLEFRDWYAKSNIGQDIHKWKFKLLDWIEKIKAYKIPTLNALAITIKRHSGQILNYFIGGHSNAPAEALNRNIKKFIGVNYGIRELDYFYYRLNILHLSTSI